MLRSLGLRRTGARALVLTALLTALTASTARAQAAFDPRVLEFIPSTADGERIADGRPAVTQYDVEIAVAGTAQVLQRVTLGKPPLAADGMMRVNLADRLTAAPVAGVSYVAHVLAVGPLGTTASVASNPFTLSRCQVGLTTASGTLPAAGGDGAVDVVASSPSCGWTVGASAAWLKVVGSPAGLGAGRIAFTAAANTSTAARVATLAVGSLVYTVTQAGVTPRTVLVATEPQLQAAVAALTSQTTILLAPGRYKLRTTLQVVGKLAGVALKGHTGQAADVVIEGAGMTVASAAPTALRVSGVVKDLQIADLTIRGFAANAIVIEAGAQAPRLTNLRLLDAGAALVKVIGDVADGLVEGSSFEYTTTGTSKSAGLQLVGASGWTIRGNAFRQIRTAKGAWARPAVSASAGASDTTVEQNLFFNCQTGVALGLTDQRDGVDHRGGRVANNFIYRGKSVAGGPGIAVVDSPGTVVVHNTVVLSQTAAASIEYREAGATALIVANNLVDGPIVARAGAWAIASGNVTRAPRSLFVDAPAGDLHLRATAAAALDVADLALAEPTDIDGHSRARDAGPDVGADEFVAPAR